MDSWAACKSCFDKGCAELQLVESANAQAAGNGNQETQHEVGSVHKFAPPLPPSDGLAEEHEEKTPEVRGVQELYNEIMKHNEKDVCDELKCGKSHSMHPCPATDDGCFCDSCQKSVSEGTMMYSCYFGCNYDICQDCWKTCAAKFVASQPRPTPVPSRKSQYKNIVEFGTNGPEGLIENRKHISCRLKENPVTHRMRKTIITKALIEKCGEKGALRCDYKSCFHVGSKVRLNGKYKFDPCAGNYFDPGETVEVVEVEICYVRVKSTKTDHWERVRKTCLEAIDNYNLLTEGCVAYCCTDCQYNVCAECTQDGAANIIDGANGPARYPPLPPKSWKK